MTRAETLTTHDLAELLGCSEPTIRRMRLRGVGPRYITVGGSIRYLAADVDAWLAAGGDAPKLKPEVADGNAI